MLIKTKKNILFVFILFFPPVAYSFSFKPDPLTDKDIQQYIQAYSYIAEVTDEIVIEKKKLAEKTLVDQCHKLEKLEDTISSEVEDIGARMRGGVHADVSVNCNELYTAIPVIACSSCRNILSNAVRKAGFKGLKSFTYMDIRIHLAMYSYYELQLTKHVAEFAVSITGGANSPDIKISAEDYCQSRATLKDESNTTLDDNHNETNKENKKDSTNVKEDTKNNNDELSEVTLEQTCIGLVSIGGYIQKISKLTLQIAKRLLQKGDIAKVGEHIEALNKVLTNENLIDDFKHTRGGFDD